MSLGKLFYFNHFYLLLALFTMSLCLYYSGQLMNSQLSFHQIKELNVSYTPMFFSYHKNGISEMSASAKAKFEPKSSISFLGILSTT